MRSTGNGNGSGNDSGNGNSNGDGDSGCGDHRDDDGDDGDDGDVALAMKTLRRDALRRRRGKGGGRGALIADTADDYDCEDRYRRRRTPHRISLNPRDEDYSCGRPPSITRHTTRRGTLSGHLCARDDSSRRGIIPRDAHAFVSTLTRALRSSLARGAT